MCIRDRKREKETAGEAGYEQKKILERQDPGFGHKSVSYTHLDVYKRQGYFTGKSSPRRRRCGGNGGNLCKIFADA